MQEIKDRTEFNYSFVSLTKPALQEQVYSKLKENKIYYNDSKNTNLLNGAIVTSRKDFFQSLGKVIGYKDDELATKVGLQCKYLTLNIFKKTFVTKKYVLYKCDNKINNNLFIKNVPII